LLTVAETGDTAIGAAGQAGDGDLSERGSGQGGEDGGRAHIGGSTEDATVDGALGIL